MKFTLIGRKQGMTQVFDEKGNRIPVTVVSVGPCVVTQIKREEKDGYSAIQIAFEDQKQQRLNKPELGHFKRGKTPPKKVLREFRVASEDCEKFELGQSLTADNFQAGDFVDVTGTSKGRGFAGVMKRHNFHGFKASHGVHESYRGPGSIGMNTWPGRVIPGKKLAGHMGAERVTVQNLKILEVHPEENVVLIRGSLPGHRRDIVQIALAVKKTHAEREFGKKAEVANEPENAPAEEAQS